MNFHIQNQLRKHFRLSTSSPIVPRVSKLKKLYSQVQRYILRRPSSFFYFSKSTLESNAHRASSQYENKADAVFFRSATRWCHCKPSVPYFIYLDVVFHTYFKNTFDQSDFSEQDVTRIFESEARFLEAAAVVFFESNWGLQKAIKAYSLKGSHYIVASRGGVLEPPAEDDGQNGPTMLLSIAKNFEQKGGDLILQAFKKLKKNFPSLSWHIVGGEPTGDWKSESGIVYEGFLNPDNDKDLIRYRKLFSEAFLLVHPTREDTNPLVVTEAGYFGCPTISVNRFALPELIVDAKTGVLLDWPIEPAQLAQSIEKLIKDKDHYKELRRACRKFSLQSFQWSAIGSHIADEVNRVLNQHG